MVQRTARINGLKPKGNLRSENTFNFLFICVDSVNSYKLESVL